MWANKKSKPISFPVKYSTFENLNEPLPLFEQNQIFSS